MRCDNTTSCSNSKNGYCNLNLLICVGRYELEKNANRSDTMEFDWLVKNYKENVVKPMAFEPDVDYIILPLSKHNIKKLTVGVSEGGTLTLIREGARFVLTEHELNMILLKSFSVESLQNLVIAKNHLAFRIKEGGQVL